MYEVTVFLCVLVEKGRKIGCDRILLEFRVNRQICKLMTSGTETRI